MLRRAENLTRRERHLPAWQRTPLPVHALAETRLLPAKTQRFIEFPQERLGQRAADVAPPAA